MTSSLPSKFEVILASSKCFISSKNFVFYTPDDVNYRIISMSDDVDLRVALSYIVKSRNLGVISTFWLQLRCSQNVEMTPKNPCFSAYIKGVEKTVDERF
jgi:hypothetical protein